jgi:hypothetical protein
MRGLEIDEPVAQLPAATQSLGGRNPAPHACLERLEYLSDIHARDVVRRR